MCCASASYGPHATTSQEVGEQPARQISTSALMYSKVLQCKTFMVWQHLTQALELLAVHQARAGMPCNSSKVHKLSALTCGGDGGAGEPGV